MKNFLGLLLLVAFPAIAISPAREYRVRHEREIVAEQERAGIHDPTHFAYPTYAKAAIARRENLKRSADELVVQLDEAKAALQESFEDLKKVELLDERDQVRDRAADEAREQAELDALGSLRARSALA